MKISSSDITLQSQHVKREETTERESLRMWVGNERPNFEGRGPNGNELIRPAMGEQLKISDRAREVSPVKVEAELGEDDNKELSPKEKLNIMILSKFYEQVTGKKLEITTPDEVVDESKIDELPEELSQASAAQGGNGPQRAGFGIEYDYYYSHREYEKTTFSANGVINTADGKEVNFSVDLAMSREFMQEQSISIRAGDAVVKDPLVINFDGRAAELTETRFSFDLDADGRKDQVSFVGPGSGFLALDKNQDGIVNDGSELFGPQSGDGFAELAAYDQDGNQWIDENDTVYDSLRIWSRDAAGNESLIGLGSAGVGAIYLGHLNTSFDIKDSNNNLQGQVVSSGVYVNENGTVGTIQQIDLVV
jgi:hypothetical protein